MTERPPIDRLAATRSVGFLSTRRCASRPNGFVALALVALLPASAGAHIVPRAAHDRTITVRPAAEGVTVTYRLEVDGWTVLADLARLRDDLGEPDAPLPEGPAKFARVVGPLLAANLRASLDGEALTFRPSDDPPPPEVTDHLAFTLTFRADWRLTAGERHAFRFKDNTYPDDREPARVDLSLAEEPGARLLERDEPDAAVKSRPTIDRQPGDEKRLRTASAVVALAADSSPAEPPAEAATPADHSHSLLRLLDAPHGLGALLLLAALFGAAHALTPGHGKTAAAAYLVGSRGTYGHAFWLGLVTTVTHTGAVILVAAVLPRLAPGLRPDQTQAAFGFFGGLLLAGLGVWLSLCRLTGRADHIHLGGGHHHHHPHDDAAAPPVTRWGLLVLGVQGGLIPCWDAVAMLGFTIAAGRPWLGLPLLVAFSAGLAATLVAVGCAVVTAQRLGGRRLHAGRLGRLLPLLSALLLVGLGLWLCRDSLTPTGP